VNSKCQSKKEYDPSMHITYVTEGKDTLYVIQNIYSVFDEIWSEPRYKSEKPVLVSVYTLAPFYAKSKKSKSKNIKKDKITTTKINQKKSKKKTVKNAKRNPNGL